MLLLSDRQRGILQLALNLLVCVDVQSRERIGLRLPLDSLLFEELFLQILLVLGDATCFLGPLPLLTDAPDLRFFEIDRSHFELHRVTWLLHHHHLVEPTRHVNAIKIVPGRLVPLQLVPYLDRRVVVLLGEALLQLTLQAERLVAEPKQEAQVLSDLAHALEVATGMGAQPLHLDFLQRLPCLVVDRCICESIARFEIVEFPLSCGLLQRHTHLKQDTVYLIRHWAAQNRLCLISHARMVRHRLCEDAQVAECDLAGQVGTLAPWLLLEDELEVGANAVDGELTSLGALDVADATAEAISTVLEVAGNAVTDENLKLRNRAVIFAHNGDVL